MHKDTVCFNELFLFVTGNFLASKFSLLTNVILIFMFSLRTLRYLLNTVSVKHNTHIFGICNDTETY